jgi:hypothetical protein
MSFVLGSDPYKERTFQHADLPPPCVDSAAVANNAAGEHPDMPREDYSDSDGDDEDAGLVLLAIAELTGSPLARSSDARRGASCSGGGTEALEAVWALATAGVDPVRIAAVIQCCGEDPP